MDFKFPSLHALAKGMFDTFRRFPFSLICAMMSSGVFIFMLEHNFPEKEEYQYLWKVVMCCWLGLNLFLALTLISERNTHGTVQKYFLQFAGILLTGGYYFLLPAFGKMTVTDMTRYALFTIGLHLFVSFSPFIAPGGINGFWQFNKTLFLRYLLSALYSAVLFAGLALALFAVDQLFNAGIRHERYGQLWSVLAGIFNTWFFLAGVPNNLDKLETIVDFPRGLKIFTQFVLLPLVAIYLFILYAYGIKIVFQWELPKGWVSWLVNAFSVFGILSLLLIWPVRSDEGNKWISTFSRWFYRALFPLVVLLGLAIGKRILQYGITENRYFVLVVALWLTGIAAYFLLSKSKNIKLIPVSLCIIAFLSSFGPWGAFRISERSQVKRLEKLLTEEKILVNGRVHKVQGVTVQNGSQISSIVRYLGSHHGFNAIRPWFDENLDSLLTPKDSNDYVYEAGKVLNLMGVDDYYDYRYEEEDTTALKSFNFYSSNDDRQAVSVAGFDYVLKFYTYYAEDHLYEKTDNYRIRFGNDSGLIKYSKELKLSVLEKNGRNVLQFDMEAFVRKISDYNKAHRKYEHDDNISREQMLFEAQNDSVKLSMQVASINGTISKEGVRVSNIDGILLLKFSAKDSSGTVQMKK